MDTLLFRITEVGVGGRSTTGIKKNKGYHEQFDANKYDR